MLAPQPVASAPVAHARPCPRRRAARDLVSVPRKRQKVNHILDEGGSISGVASAPPPLQLSSLQHKSNQEPEGNSSASRWFDHANSNLGHGLQDLSCYDDEPPFFISRNDPSERFDFVEHVVPGGEPFGGYSHDDSEREDLRDVIDDLTIENRRLKQLLKDRKVQQDSQDRHKLFEVRVHGLPSDKKRELEQLLRNFASNLDSSSALPSRPVLGIPSNSQKPIVDSHFSGAPLQARQTDSGYASNSNSGQTSATPSNPGRPVTFVSRKNNDKTVKSYLHKIPNGLLPKQPLVMSERAKMSLVVRRLENLFIGKKAGPGEHSQPLQQQEVSRLAADADMQSASIKQRQEGSREAQILPFDSEVNLERVDWTESSSSDRKLRVASKSQGSEKSTSGVVSSPSSAHRSPDQRPTRPLDLDVHRAQVAEENIEYLRHLGLTSPKLNVETDKENGEGWIYLNLLISMAQLHTINVTSAFIKKSIKTVSAKFELSQDGNKVRWRKGNDAKHLPAEPVQDSDMVDGKSADGVVGLETSDNDKPFDGMTLSNPRTSATPSEHHSSNQLTSQSSMRVQPFSITPELTPSILASRSQPASSFDYRPILLTGKSLLRPQPSYLDESSGSQSHLDDSSLADSTETSDGIADDTGAGPIVFYNSTLFCSDFSGDRAPTNLRRPNSETSSCPLGVNAAAQLDEMRERDGSYFAKNPVAPVLEQTFDALRLDLAPIVNSCNAEQKLREMPASGIGGVTPQDHFLVQVQIARTASTARDGEKAGVGKRNPQNFRYRIVTCSKTNLPPSQLPPPSYIFLSFTSSSSSAVDEAWDSEDEAAETSIDEHEPLPPTFLAQFSTEDSSPNHGDEEMDSDSSVDMLATARTIDPATIAAREREFEANMKAMRMEEDVVAESLVATAGNGSEFDSGDESDVDESSSCTDSDGELWN